MRALVDEGVPRELVTLLLGLGCDIAAFPNAWKGTKNGRLIGLIENAGFGCLVTCDKNFRHQQNIAATRIALLILPDPRLERLRPMLAQIAKALADVKPGEVHVLRLNQ